MEFKPYDFPRNPEIENPTMAQRHMVRFQVLNRRAFNLSDMGCVGGETLIDTSQGKIPIHKLDEFGVRALTPDGPRFVPARAFAKGTDKLFRVSFASGRSIVVTKRHVFLTCRGWSSCEKLRIGEYLPVFDVYPQQSTWERCHVRSPLDVHRLMEIISSSQGSFETLVYDEQPLLVVNTDLALAPSLVDAPTHTRFWWHTDDRGNKCIHTDPSFAGPPSSLRYDARIDQGEMGAFLSECATKQTGNQLHISARYHLFPSQRREVPQGQELRLCIPLNEASAPPLDMVAHIAYEREDVYYDMRVPTHENYVAHGLCHHNTMKTLATLWAADWIMQSVAPIPMRAIIVTTLSTVEEVWARSIAGNFFGRRTFAILHGSEQKRREELAREVDFYIINYDGLKVGAKFVDVLRADGTPRGFRRLELTGFAAELVARRDIQIVIVDEASAYKASNRGRHKVFTRLFSDRTYMWALTGTPTPNGPPDAYGLAKLLGRTNGETYASFHNRTMFQISQYKWEPRRDGYDAARALLQPAIRFDIRDVWDGPPCTTQRRHIDLTPQQRKMIHDLQTDFVTYVKNTKDPVAVVAENSAVVRTKVLQVSLGAIYDQDHKAHRLDNSPRFAELTQVIENTRQKILIFSPFTSVVDFLYENLREKYTTERVTGATTAKNRSHIFRSFQGSVDPRIIVADPGCMAHGVELFAASASIWYGPTDKPELYEQANKRAHRPGQQHPVSIVQFVATRIEREIFDRIANKQNLQGLMLKAVREEWSWI